MVYDLDDMLAACPEIDVVSVCTPNGLHAEHSIKALKAGRHVFVKNRWRSLFLIVPQ